MSIQSIIRRIPDYAEDIKQNFADIFNEELEGLTEQQVYGVALAVSYSLKHEQLFNNIRDHYVNKTEWSIDTDEHYLKLRELTEIKKSA